MFLSLVSCIAIDLFVIFQLLVDEYNEGEKRRQAMVAKLDELRSRNKFVRGENAYAYLFVEVASSEQSLSIFIQIYLVSFNVFIPFRCEN